MKLLLCIKCNDIFNLTMEERTCKCGKSSGKCIDKFNVEIRGDCMPIGFANQSFLDALKNQHIKNKNYDGNKDTRRKGQEFTAFVIPDWARSVKRVVTPVTHGCPQCGSKNVREEGNNYHQTDNEMEYVEYMRCLNCGHGFV